MLDKAIARQVKTMLKAVTAKGGTGTRAAIPTYQVAGKTGTVHKVGKQGYEENRYVALFAGMVPADDPRLVTVVIINDPRGVAYNNGQISVSRIYDWFIADFGGTEEAVLTHLDAFAEPELRSQLGDIARLGGQHYDWSLNDTRQ